MGDGMAVTAQYQDAGEGEDGLATDEPGWLLAEVAAALRWARLGGAEAVDRAAVSWQPLPVAPAAPRGTSRPAGSDAGGHTATPARSWQGEGAAYPGLLKPEPTTRRPAALDPVPGQRLRRRAPLPDAPAVAVPKARDADARAALAALAAEVEGCTRCPLHAGRRHVVRGEGNPRARLMLVVAAPASEDDMAGHHLQGAAGALLDRMLAAMGLTRADIWITSLVMCGPGDGTVPPMAALRACTPYLRRQVDLIRPAVLLAMGEAPGRVLLKRLDADLATLRGPWHPVVGVPLLVTHAPASLLAGDPVAKREAWQDLQRIMQRLDLPGPG